MRIQKLVKNNEAKDTGIISKTKVHQGRVTIIGKLIVSYILIGILPMLTVVLLLLSNAEAGILEEVEVANQNFVKKTALNLNLLESIVIDTSKLIVTDFELLNIVAKDESDYSSKRELDKDRSTYIDPMFMTMQITNPSIIKIAFIKDNEVYASGQRLSQYNYLYDNNFSDAFFEGQQYKALTEAKSKVHWYYYAYDTDTVFFYS